MTIDDSLHPFLQSSVRIYLIERDCLHSVLSFNLVTKSTFGIEKQI